MSIILLELISLDEKNKTLHIAYMIFLIFFLKLVELIDYHYHLM